MFPFDKEGNRLREVECLTKGHTALNLEELS